VGVRVSSFEGVVAARPAAPEGLDGPGGQLMLPIPADRRADRRAERLASG
jgi:hypothetical protein